MKRELNSVRRVINRQYLFRAGLAALLLIPCSSSLASSDICNMSIDEAEVESSISVDESAMHRTDIAQFNEMIGEIPAQAESWIMDPVRVVLEFLGTPGSRSVTIKRCDASGEAAAETSVRVLEDGYLDDSTRGTWYNFKLTKDEQGRWLLGQGREAYRCWRGHHKESYSSKQCK